MSATTVWVFDTMEEAAEWAAMMEGEGFAVAVSDESDSVTLRYKKDGAGKTVTTDPGNRFVVMAFNGP